MMKRMMKRLGAGMLALVLGLPLFACAAEDGGAQGGLPVPESKPEEKEAERHVEMEYSSSGIAVPEKAVGAPMSEEFVRAAADFGLSMLKQQKKGVNTMLSPVSLLCALGMTANGAAGDTLSQMEDVLFGGIPAEEANRYFLHYRENLPDGQGGVSLRIANSVWFNDMNADFAVNTEFLSKNASYYGAGAFGRNFRHPDTVTEVNRWVSDNTDGMIPSILDKLTGEELMLLVNTVLFDGKWKETYKDSDILPMYFNAYDGSKNEVDMLCSKEGRYFTLGEGMGFIRPYAERYSFVGILPDEGVDVYEYAASLTGDALVDAIKKPVFGQARVRIPEFTFDYGVSAVEALRALGMTDAFDGDRADFSRLGEMQGANLFVSDVIHKTRIELSRTGTKAAAATAVVVAPTSAGPSAPKPVEIYLDRPFVFAITDNETGLVLFCGIVTEIE